MHGHSEIQADVFAEERAQLRRSLRRVETSQWDSSNEAFAVPVDQCFGERVRAIQFCIAIGAEDEHSFLAQLSEQMSKEPDCTAVGPMQVVRIEEQTLFAREMREHLRDSIEEKQPLLMRRQLRMFHEGAETGLNLGRKLRRLLGRITEQGAQCQVILLPPHPMAKSFPKG